MSTVTEEPPTMARGFASYADAVRQRGFADPPTWDEVWEDPVERFAIGLYCKSFMTPEDLSGTYTREAGRAEMLHAWTGGHDPSPGGARGGTENESQDMQIKERKKYRRWAAALGPLTVRRPAGA